MNPDLNPEPLVLSREETVAVKKTEAVMTADVTDNNTTGRKFYQNKKFNI